MNVQKPWNTVFLLGFVVFVGIRTVYAKRTKAETKSVSRMDGLEKALLAAMFPPTMVLPLAYLFTPWLALADYRLPPAAGWCGAAAMVASLWLFRRSHADLGNNWSVSVELRVGHQLVTDGVYRYVRHPMYASIWLWCFAQGLLLENWIAGWSILPVFAAMYFLRVPREERLMVEAFGGKYEEYARRTGRVLPRLKNVNWRASG